MGKVRLSKAKNHGLGGEKKQKKEVGIGGVVKYILYGTNFSGKQGFSFFLLVRLAYKLNSEG